ncbi:putative signal peptide protein [Puccinia sorghi]|uniref:Putative signal peptide protein n=1 Tax=Puccinia sorghi TaxID=27349 RepID=A0A0L6USF2_9BASI|nr:putative signal peptide protein [Puccinia sorghi]
MTFFHKIIPLHLLVISTHPYLKISLLDTSTHHYQEHLIRISHLINLPVLGPHALANPTTQYIKAWLNHSWRKAVEQVFFLVIDILTPLSINRLNAPNNPNHRSLTKPTQLSQRRKNYLGLGESVGGSLKHPPTNTHTRDWKANQISSESQSSLFPPWKMHHFCCNSPPSLPSNLPRLMCQIEGDRIRDASRMIRISPVIKGRSNEKIGKERNKERRKTQEYKDNFNKLQRISTELGTNSVYDQVKRKNINVSAIETSLVSESFPLFVLGTLWFPCRKLVSNTIKIEYESLALSSLKIERYIDTTFHSYLTSPWHFTIAIDSCFPIACACNFLQTEEINAVHHPARIVKERRKMENQEHRMLRDLKQQMRGTQWRISHCYALRTKCDEKKRRTETEKVKESFGSMIIILKEKVSCFQATVDPIFHHQHSKKITRNQQIGKYYPIFRFRSLSSQNPQTPTRTEDKNSTQPEGDTG